MISRSHRAVTALAFGLLSILAPAARGADAPLRVLILSDGGDRGGASSAPILRQILSRAGRFDVRVCESPAGLSGRTLEGFDLVVDDVSGGPPGGETEAAIAGFVESGKGLVVTHGALTSRRGYARPWPVRPTEGAVPAVQFLTIEFVAPEHPIVRGVKGGFRTPDATLRGLIPTPPGRVIATVADGEAVKAEPALVATESGKGRAVAIALGHDESARHEPAFAAIFARSCEWAASGAVTLPAVAGADRPSHDAARALLITGGHDHDAAFYALFDGLARLPVDTAANAFKKDLRGTYDVVIMYDFSRDLDDAGKAHLRAFVEGGGGVVVLHHALLNYQDWAWWDDEVVGGSYRLTNPSSRVKDDQQIFAVPAKGHPITAGLAPFHIQDEAYQNLRMSPKIRPLLTTDNPTSDANLAWIGPRDGSRVVAIQLGHGPSAFNHPSYRALVHNAVLWAAGKIK